MATFLGREAYPRHENYTTKALRFSDLTSACLGQLLDCWYGSKSPVFVQHYTISLVLF